MSGMLAAARRTSLAFLALTTLGAPPAAAQGDPQPGTSMFVVMLAGSRVGTERVSLTRTGGGWLISASSQLVSPFNLLTNKFEVSYGSDWQPRELVIDARIGGEPLSLQTTFGLTTASTEMVQGGRRASSTGQVSPRTVVVPNNFFAAYEAMAVRLKRSAVGDRFPVFIAPTGEVSATVDRIIDRAISTPTDSVVVSQYDVTYATPGGPLAVQVWADSVNRLARVVIPAAGLAVIREDIASVMAREETIRHPTDEDVFIPANGFSIAATITTPTTPVDEPPIVILVPGAGPEDRDYTRYGVPIFGRLAGRLAEAGYFVVRYDKRGVGQSGGRAESAAIDQFAEDVRAVVRWARRRDDVDDNIVFVIGHGEGAVVALRTADREGRVRGVALLSAAADRGYELALARQREELAASSESETDKQAKIALQQRTLEAVITGDGWEAVPEQVRRQADTAWFRSWLLFEPAEGIRRVDEPILIVHGALDREVPASHADRLAAFSRLRDEPETHTRAVVVTGANHLLVPATTGEVDEYSTLDPQLAPEAVAAIIDWLDAVTAERRR